MICHFRRIACKTAKLEYLGKTICVISQASFCKMSPIPRYSAPCRRENFAVMAGGKAYGAVRDDVPHRMRQIRQAQGLSLEQLAERMGMTSQTLQKYETEPQRLRVYQLRQLAAALGCSVSELVGENNPLSPIEQEAIADFREMSLEDQHKALAILKALSGKAANDTAA